MKKRIGLVIAFLVALFSVYSLFRLMASPIFPISIFDKEILNFYASYEASSLLVAVGLLAVLYFFAGSVRLTYLALGDINAPVGPVRILGIRNGEGWRQIGLTIGGIVTLVTGIVVYLQIASQSGLDFRTLPEIPLILLFALMNSFTEEVIFRLSYVTIVAEAGYNRRFAEILGALVFGIVHYFGIAPNGIFGALMAAFLGWFLTKSIHETHGFFWAWSIHFAQDVVILFFLFMRA